MTWLNELSEVDRIRVARLLADTRTIRELADAADATVYELTRTATAAAVAERLGLSAKQVKRAVEQHAARLRAAPPTGDPAPP